MGEKKPLLLNISGGAPVYSSHVTLAWVRRATVVMKGVSLNCVAYIADKHSSPKIWEQTGNSRRQKVDINP